MRALRRRQSRGAASLALWLALSASALAAPRLVAVGDVHGDLPAFKAILAQAGILDKDGAWAGGGDAILVQMGDLIDRGPAMKATLDFAMALEAQAPGKGGRAVFLLGNHEVMNMAGDLRYVAAENYAEFADGESPKRREDAWNLVVELRKKRASLLGRPDPAVDAKAKEAWLAAHPLGYVEQREAFSPAGKYGRWLRAHAAAALVEDTVFLHGGIAPALAGTVEDLNRRVRDDLAAYDADEQQFVAQGLILPFFDLQETFKALHEELERMEAAGAAAKTSGKPVPPPDAAKDAARRKVYERFLDWSRWTMNSEDGPLWFRGYGRWSDAEGLVEIPKLLSAAHAVRFVVGHTVQKDGRIVMRFDGTTFMIDTGMLDGKFFPGGRASALEISDGAVTAIYPGEEPQLLRAAPVRKAAALR